MQTVKNVVLVHGAWADGSSWSKVIPLLQAKGLQAVAVQDPLTSTADYFVALFSQATERLIPSSREIPGEKPKSLLALAMGNSWLRPSR